MRLLFLADASSPHARRWCEAAEELGHEVLLASAQPNSFGWHSFVPLAELGKLTYLLAADDVRALAAEVDQVIAHFLPAYGLSAALSGVPFKLVVWGSDVLAWPRGWRRRVARFVLSRASWVAADSFEVRRHLRALGYPPSRVKLFAHGPSPDVWEVPVKGKEPLIIHARPLEPLYRPLDIVRAASGLGARLAFTHTGSLAKQVEHEGYAWGVRAELLGFLNRREYLELLARARVFVSFPRWDATSVALLEAMALGSVPVLSDTPSAREWVLDGVNGLLVKNSAGLKRALKRALEDDELLKNTLEINPKLVREKSRWPEGLAEFIELPLEAPPQLLKEGVPWSYLV